MRSGQCKAGVLEVIEFSREPGIHGVTVLTRGRKTEGYMIKVRSEVILLVAGVAGRGKSFELPGRGSGVTFGAVGKRVGAHQRESILVIPDHIEGYIPALDGVTLLAVGPHLATMNIGVAVGAMGADIAEHEADVTLDAGDFLVHAAQWITGLIVIKLGQGANGLPTGKRVAILTRHGHAAVRVSHLCVRGIPGLAWGIDRALRQHPQQERQQTDQSRKEPVRLLHASSPSKWDLLRSSLNGDSIAMNFHSHHLCKRPKATSTSDANCYGGRRKTTSVHSNNWMTQESDDE